MKSVGVAYLCWFLGAHRFYLDSPLSGCLYIMTCAGCGWWGLIDLFLIPTMTQQCNLMARMNEGVTVTVINESRPSKSGKRKRRD